MVREEILMVGEIFFKSVSEKYNNWMRKKYTYKITSYFFTTGSFKGVLPGSETIFGI